MERKYITVTTLNKYLKNKFDTDPHIQSLCLKGEISNFKGHTRGHLYFTLKDEGSRINAVMFSSSASKLNFVPKDGMKVLVVGRVSVYEPNGGYQIYINEMIEDGVGNLYLKFEELKKKLSGEGLFDPIYKKQIPKFPTKIGIITAPTGAAIRDILSTIKRRYPNVETILFPSLVQGELAPNDIVKQIKIADTYDLDVLIVGRGGGSIEDLWSFNEEIVARAIFEAQTPIISAVGHEIDFTISDFVADLRAPTPTGAAEMAVPNIVDVKNFLNQLNIRLNKDIENILEKNKKLIKTYKESYVLSNPLATFEIKEQKLDNLINEINTKIKYLIDFRKDKLKTYKNTYVLSNPLTTFEIKKQNIDNLSKHLNTNIKNILDIKTKSLETIKLNHFINNPDSLIICYNNSYELLLNKLNLLNPLNVLSKGYSVVNKNNKTIKSIKDLKVNDKINIKLYKGNVDAIIEGINE